MTSTVQTEIKILSPGATNDVFDKNLIFFQSYRPEKAARIKSHQCTKFQLCFNPDESLNILDIEKQSLLYPANQKGINIHFDATVKSMSIKLDQHATFLAHKEGHEYHKNYAPFQTKFHQKLFDISHLSGMIDTKTNKLHVSKERITFLPILRVYGIGLGHHIVSSINKYDINCLIIHEPEFDLFYCSLFTVPWDQIFSHFINTPNKHCQLNTDNVEIAIKSETNLLNKLHPFFYCGKAHIHGFFDRDFQHFMDKEIAYDQSNFTLKATGYYDDQVRGLKHSLANIKAKKFYYCGKKANKKFTVFLVGSGPSLTESIEYIKRHHNSAIIIACGSAISILNKHKIFPDYHILQERPFSIKRLLQLTDKESYKKTSCIKLNVVSPEIDELYKDSIIIQKFNDPGSTLLPTDKYPPSCNVTPTVTNSGITICKVIGAKTVYLFGIDYGTPEDNQKNHAEGVEVFSLNDGYSIVDHKDDNVNKEESLIIEGNFGKKIYANEFLFWSKDVANIALNEKDAKKIKWINVGDGAKLDNCVAMHANKLPVPTIQNLDKDLIKKAIKDLFSNQYSIDNVKTTIQNVHIPASQNYIIALLEAFEIIPDNRNAIMTTLGLITDAANIGVNENGYLPRKLFGTEFVNFLNILYIQVFSTTNDTQAIELYRNAIPELKSHLERVYEDFINICSEFIDHDT